MAQTGGTAEDDAAAGIDTGGHKVGTQAAADHVLDEKLKAAQPFSSVSGARPIPEELVAMFSRIDENPKIEIAEAFKAMEGHFARVYSLIDKGSESGSHYARHVFAMREKNPRGMPLPVEAVKVCLLDMFEELEMVED